MQVCTTYASQRGPYEGTKHARFSSTARCRPRALQDAAQTLVGTSAAGPLGNALIELRHAMNAVSAEMAEEAAAERQLAEADPYQVALAMSSSGTPDTVDGRSIWAMSSAELAADGRALRVRDGRSGVAVGVGVRPRWKRGGMITRDQWLLVRPLFVKRVQSDPAEAEGRDDAEKRDDADGQP